MSILLTNGTYYIAHSKKGAVVKVSDIKKAQDFYSVERAIAQKNKTLGKCASYYFIDTDKMEQETVPEEKKEKPKRKKRKYKAFSMQKRLKIYWKTEGHCYLCGEFVDFNSFEVEHNIPVSKGGTNELDNLFCACHCCNAIKHDIYPEDLMEKISRIFMYQMGIKSEGCGRGEHWQSLCKELKEML